MTCRHKHMNFNCVDCRRKIKWFDSETEFQLYKIKESCKKLERLVEKHKVSGLVYDSVYNVIDEIDGFCGLIKKEIKHEDLHTGYLWPTSNSRRIDTSK